MLPIIRVLDLGISIDIPSNHGVAALPEGLPRPASSIGQIIHVRLSKCKESVCAPSVSDCISANLRHQLLTLPRQTSPHTSLVNSAFPATSPPYPLTRSKTQRSYVFSLRRVSSCWNDYVPLLKIQVLRPMQEGR